MIASLNYIWSAAVVVRETDNSILRTKKRRKKFEEKPTLDKGTEREEEKRVKVFPGEESEREEKNKYQSMSQI